METNIVETTSTCLTEDFKLIQNLINYRISGISKRHDDKVDIHKLSFVPADNSSFGQLIRSYQLNSLERLILAISIAPTLSPGLLDNLVIQASSKNHILSMVGGITGSNKNYHGLIPTIETLVFILTDGSEKDRLELLNYFAQSNKLIKSNLIEYSSFSTIEPFSSRGIIPSLEVIHFIITAKEYQPEFSNSFPATSLTTRLSWEDLVLKHETLEEIYYINAWLKHGTRLLNEYGLAKNIKPGLRALFYGPPGTGKTLTAAILGKINSMDVYRIDLSLIVSKYIGETEKNLATLFNKAENKNWILFFDEADALFGKRSQTKDAKDRYANQEIAYLLQRIEDYPGTILLATNQKNNMDEAFNRRFQSFVHFPMPDSQLRLRLWQNSLPEKLTLEKGFSLKEIADNYELSGGSISNVIRYVTLMAIERSDNELRRDDFMRGVIKEFGKEGKTI